MSEMTETEPNRKSDFDSSHEGIVDSGVNSGSPEPTSIKEKMFEGARKDLLPADLQEVRPDEGLTPVGIRQLSDEVQTRLQSANTVEVKAPAEDESHAQTVSGGMMSRRKFLGFGTGAVLAVAIGAEESKYGKIRNFIFGGGTKKNGTGLPVVDATKEVGKKPTNTPTEVPSPRATEAPTSIPTPENVAPTYGDYKSVEELPVSESRKEAIGKLTEDCDIQIIVKNGLIALQKGAEDRSSTIKRYDGSMTPVGQIHSLALNTEALSDASKRLSTAFERTKLNAWKLQTNSPDTTIDEYEASKNGSHPFKVAVTDGKTSTLQEVTDSAFGIFKFLADDLTTNIMDSTSLEYKNEFIDDDEGGVFCVGNFFPDPGGIDEVDGEGEPRSKYYPATSLASSAASLGIDPSLATGSGKYSLSLQRSRITPSLYEIADDFGITNPHSLKGVETIFTVTGTKVIR